MTQNLRPYDTAKLVDPQTVEVDKKDANGNVINGADGQPLKEKQVVTEQVIAQGPVASQEIIKEWGTNGGGFFNANSAHPFENPTPFTNLFEMFAIFAISAGLTYTLGRMTGSQKHGWAVFAAMVFLFFVGITVAYWAAAKGNPMLAGVDQSVSSLQSGGNMEGKEVRYGIANSALRATITTDTSCGAVNAMHDSFTPPGALTTFSIANDVAKYFAIIPTMFSAAFPVLNALNIMKLATPQSAILSALIFNALIIIALIPLALKGVRYRPLSASTLLRRNLLVYGFGGVIIPFIGIKLIDVVIVALGLA